MQQTSKRRCNITAFLLFLTLFLILSNVHFPISASIVSGGWYNADFEIYPNGTKFINESVGGQKWVFFDGEYNGGNGEIFIPSGETPKHYGITSTGTEYCRVNFSDYFNYFALKFYGRITANGNWYSYVQMRGDDETNVFNLRIQYVSGGGGSLYVFDKDNVNKWNYALGTDVKKQYWINVTKNTNDTYKLIFATYGDDTENTLYVNYSGYATNIYVYTSGTCTTGTGYACFENVRVKSPMSGYPWDVDYTKSGDSGLTTGWSTVSTSINNDFYLLETDFKKSVGETITLKQIALPLHHTVGSPSNLNVNLYVNDYQLGSYDTYYIWNNDRFICVWNNLNIAVSGETNILLEFLISASSGQTLTWFTMNSDQDSDGDRYYYHADGGDALTSRDGSYGGTGAIGSNLDLMYSIWYQSSLTGDSWEESEYNNEGYVGNDDIDNMTITNTTLEDYYYLIEQKFNTNENLEVKKVAVAVSKYTDIYNITAYLRINDEWCSEYDYRYYNNNTYIYVWDDTSVVNSGNNVIFEWEFYSQYSNNTNFAKVTYNDCDGDGSSGHRYIYSENADNYFDGMYNAPYTGTNDTLYEFWWNDVPELPSYGDDGLFFNIPVFIATLPLFIRLIIGLITTLIILTSPWWILKSLKLDKAGIQINIPNEIYVVTGVLGVVSATILRCWGWEIIFFLCFVLAIYGLFRYKQSKGG